MKRNRRTKQKLVLQRAIVKELDAKRELANAAGRGCDAAGDIIIFCGNPVYSA